MPTPRAASANRSSRTARPLMGRPVRLDLPDSPFDTAPLARIPDWNAGSSNDLGGGTLSDTVDRAAAQVLILRKAVEEAAAADRAVRQHAGELAQRLTQGQRFAAEFDQRLERAGKAAGVIEKAAAALAALDAVVAQVRGAQEAAAKNLDARVRAQEATFEQRLARQQEVFERRLGEMSASFEQRLDALAGAFDESLARVRHEATRAGEESENSIAEHRRKIMRETEQACADADRHAAQVQARASLILDGVSDRIDVLQQQCERIGNDAQQRIDTLCARAAQVLGHDPRSDFASEPALGSLADAAARADALILGVDEASVRIAAARSSAEEMLARLNAARAEAERSTTEHATNIESVRQAIGQVMEEAAAARATLEQSVRAQTEAAARSAQSSETLSRQREDLSAMAEAGRYHVEQCRTAQQALAQTIERAGACATDLDHALLEVRNQAASVVAVAKDAAALVREKAQG